MNKQPDILASLFGLGPLMITPEGLRSLAARVGQLDSNKLNESHPAQFFARTSHKYSVDKGQASFALEGPILDKPDWILDYYGVDYTVSSHFGQAITEAAAREDVEQIVISVDSPGGSVPGLQAAFEAVRDASKPVVAVVDGLMASAALYMCAGADKIIAQPASLIGSIGCVVVVRDYSKLFEDIGIQTHVISTGPQKGAGAPGSEITDEQLAGFQAIVDELGAQFVAAVAEGRGMSVEDVQKIATGEVWPGPQAVTNGIADEIHSNPLAAAGTIAHQIRKGKNMSMTKGELKGLLAAHPQHAALINEMDDKEATAEATKVAIRDAEAASRFSAVEQERDDAKAEAADANARAEAAEAKLSEVEQERDQIKADHDKLAALSTTNDPGEGDDEQPGKVPTATVQEYIAMSDNERQAFDAAGGIQVNEQPAQPQG